jgi:C-terminal processing protease CtpA/Prc
MVLFALIIQLFANNLIQGQSWSMEYILNGDSSVYTLSQNKIIQGKVVDFFFPAYKYDQTSSMSAIESVCIEHNEIIEIEFDTKNISTKKVYLEIDLYAEGIDTIQYFFRTVDNKLIQFGQNRVRPGYKYLPTAYFSANITNNDIKTIQIVGKSNSEYRKFIVGRLNGSKKIGFIAENMLAVDTIVSKYSFENQSETFVELPDHHLMLHGFNMQPRLALNGCQSTYDSIRCISQFTDKLLNEYRLYDVYGINKQELINRNAVLAETSNDINNYYSGMKEIIASLNSCHMRLSTSKNDEVESPLQPIYFYGINDEITVSAIFDPALDSRIQLGDKLLSINNISINKLYNDFAQNVFASTPQQREIKITQKLLHLAKETWGDSLSLEFKGDKKHYFICLNKSNFSGKKIVPSDFKIISDDMMEKYGKILYIKPMFSEAYTVPYLYSYKTDLKDCEGMIIDLRGCSGGDYSFCTLFSFLITEKSVILTSDSATLNIGSDYIIAPSKHINIQAPIVLLVDARTACFPEFMVNALRKIRSDIHVIGTSNTAGSAQFSMRVHLPNNAVLAYFEGVAKDSFGQAIDNNIGVAPDCLITLDSYKDLFPYNDKIKRYALKYLGYPVEEIKDNDKSQY